MKTKLWILLLPLLSLVIGCNELNSGTEDFSELDDILNNETTYKKDAIRMKSLEFSPDYKRFVIITQMNDGIGKAIALCQSAERRPTVGT